MFGIARLTVEKYLYSANNNTVEDGEDDNFDANNAHLYYNINHN
jgi:hypothetical protein